jgi:hypothetical protein
LEDGDNFDSSKVAGKIKEKKAFKKSLYQVAPKYPRPIEMEVESERAISKRFSRIVVWSLTRPRSIAILVSRSVNNTARFKIRRKGALREVGAVEGQKYAEEQAGVETGRSRSRKLIS